MSIVITTPTGNIGKALTQALIEAGERPTLIARDPAKVKAFTDAGARVVVGTHAEPEVLIEATKGAQALFLLTPPDFLMQDIRAHYRRFAEVAAEAVTKNDVPFVVHLSSVGADLERGNGPVAGLHVAEEVLNGLGRNVTHLRPAYFMENTLGQIPSILQAGALFTTFPAGTRFPMIATRDIALRAASVLRARDWKGSRVVELQGPGDTGYDEVALVLSEVLGRKLTHQTITAEQQTAAMAGMGLSKVLAESFAELAAGVTEGLIRFHEPRSAANTTPTTYPVFAQQVFKPVFQAASQG